MNDLVYCFEDNYYSEYTNIILAASILASYCGSKVLRLFSKNNLQGSDFDLIETYNFKTISTQIELESELEKNNFALSENFITTPKLCYIGVSDKKHYNSVIEYLKSNNIERAIIYSGSFVSTDYNSTIATYNNGEISSEKIIPTKFKMKSSFVNGYKGATATYNMETLTNIFNLKIKDCKTDAIVLNSALILCVSNQAKSIMDGVIKSYSILNTGKINLEELLLQK